MNNIFSFRRFGLILSKDFQENWKKYVLLFLTMFGIMAVILCIVSYNEYSYININQTHHDINNVSLLTAASLFFLGFGVLFSSTLMDSMKEKTTRISFLTIPVSNFEKFISRWLIVTVGFIIAFFIALWLADAVRVVNLSYKYPELNFGFLDFSKLIGPKTEKGYDGVVVPTYNVYHNKYFFTFCIGIYALLQSLFILGATFWERRHLLKLFQLSQ